MRDHVSHNTAFAQGVQRQLVKRAKEMTKVALNPRIAEQVLYKLRNEPELASIGESIFSKTHNQANPIAGIYNSALAGYGQLRGINQLRDTHIKELGGLNKAVHSMAAGSPEHNALAQVIAKKLEDFRTLKRQKFAELGAVAEPRRRFMRTTVPAAGALAAGTAGGLAVGNVQGTSTSQTDVAGAPFSERLNYLLHPNNIPKSTPTPQPIDSGSSATDTGGV